MNCLTTNQLRQLDQIKRHNTMIFVEVQTELAQLPRNYSSMAIGKIIGKHLSALSQTLAKKTPAKLEPSTVPGPVLFDLLIASKKYGYGSTTNADAPILWWKVAGREKQAPARHGMSILDPKLQERLLDYKLVSTEVHPNFIVRKYQKI